MNQAEKLFAELNREIELALEIPKEWLPERYQGKRSTRKLSSVVSQLRRTKAGKNPNDVSVKFDAERNITRATPERLARLESYRKQVEQHGEIVNFQVDEDKQYNKLLTFAGAMVKAGILEADDFE